MTKLLVGLLGASILVVGEARAAEMFIDGVEAAASDKPCITGYPTTLKAGYVVDPVAEAPAVGQGTVVHGMARANANCGDDVTLEFFLPPGARFDTSQPVVCNVISSTGAITPIVSLRGSPNSCRQFNEQVVNGVFGGRVFGRLSGLSLGNTFEVRVPIIFDQQLDDAPLFVAANTLIPGGIHAVVLANAPFQPALNAAAIGDDIGLLGSSSDGLPVAFSNDDGSFTVTDRLVGAFSAWARTPNVKRLTGDFNHDGLTDYALVGGAGWQSIPVAMSDGNGKFTVTNSLVGDFGNMFGQGANAKAVTGDFNKDGYTDVALVGGTGWQSIPVAFNTGNGTFTVANHVVASFPQLASVFGARPMVGDYNKDGFADIALVGGAGMTSIPVAFSFGNGQFQVTNQVVANNFCGITCNFPFIAQSPGAQFVSGDFNKDGYTDFAATAPAFGFVVATNTNFGNFHPSNNFTGAFASLASQPGAKLLTGDFNKDGYTDLATVGGTNTSSIPVLLSKGNGLFTFSDFFVGAFASWAASPGVKIVTGDYDGDGFTDIALVGGPSWSSIPVAKSLGFGIFAILNKTTNRMPAWASQGNTTAMSGPIDWN